MKTPAAPALEAYEWRLLALGNHQVNQRKQIVEKALRQSAELGWRLLRHEWSHSEINYPYEPIIKEAQVAGNLADIRRWFMTKEEHRAWQALPDALTLWRGGEEHICDAGMSWSYKQGIAERFVEIAYSDRRRLLGIGSFGRPVIVRATLSKSAIFAVKLDRQEHEVVKFPGPVAGHQKRLMNLSP